MGLPKRADSAPEFTIVAIRHWHVAAVVALLCVLVGAAGAAARELLKYDRLAIADGEYYRLVTAHFTHLGPSHLALNLAGLALIWILVGRNCSPQRWLVVIAVSILVISGGFWFIDTRMLWYVGLSGILHGLLAAGALKGLTVARTECMVILVILAAKLAWEQMVGALPGTESLSGGEVVVNAHLYGAIGGAIAAALPGRGAVGRASI